MRAVIIGGGIGGLAAGIALRQAGWDVQVFERAPEIREVGAGLILWPSAREALARLGVDAAVQAVSRAPSGARLRTPDGALLFDLAPAAWMARHFSRPAFAAHRADLLQVLQNALPPEVLHLGARCAGVRQEGDAVTALMENGAVVTGDLLIGADGLRSAVRRSLFGDRPLRYAGYVAWRAVVPFTLPDDGWFESWGPGARFGGGPLPGGRAFWFATANCPADVGSGPAERKADLPRRFGSWHAPITALIDATPEEVIVQTPLYDLPPLRHWSIGRAVLLGDAAHPTTPNLGQGACMALEDAVFLADCLNSDGSLPAALARYERRRRLRTAAVSRASRVLGWLGQWESPLACRLRTPLLRTTPAPLRLAVLKSLCRSRC